MTHLPTTEVEDFAFHHSSPHSLRDSFSSPPAPPLSQDGYDYNPASDIIDDALADDDLTQLSEDDRRLSGHSTISSFPGSVIQQAPEREPVTPTRKSQSHLLRNGSNGGLLARDVSPRMGRDFGSAFRNPGSVRAMQMREDDMESIIPQHRRSGSRMSTRSHGSNYSTHTSPSKRQSRSNQSSPLKGSKLKKEFPLVLLHCTLLPPAGSIMPIYCDNELYAALLPEEYQRRWKNLQDRLADPETKARGVLIPHPQDDYEALEEKLLECLELENPRIRKNHFLPDDKFSGDSGFESASQTEDESGDEVDQDARCPDCGKCLHLKTDGDRKWEIKVYAANGLMRAGAWAAAWREMEKVDVEISLAMPEDVRREVNGRLDALKAAQAESDLPLNDHLPPTMDPRQQEIYGSRPASSGHPGPHLGHHEDRPNGQGYTTHMTPGIGALLVDLLGDRKNLVIVMLSVMVLLYAMTGARGQRAVLPEVPNMTTSSVSGAHTTTITSTSVFTSTMTVDLPAPSIAESLVPMASGVQEAKASEALGEDVASESSPSATPSDHATIRDIQDEELLAILEDAT